MSKIDNIGKFLKRTQGINIDIGFRCPLQCPRCQRQTGFLDKGKKVHGYDLTLEEIDKLSDFYKAFVFCGQLSDPLHHPKFAEILKMLKDKEVKCEVHSASSLKPREYFIESFKSNPHAEWIFGIDGLPNESHKYRINQDGEKLFNIMVESKKYLRKTPIWQYIVFSYNENHVEQAQKLAQDSGVKFLVLQSSRWLDDNDPYKPKSERFALDAKTKTR